MANLVNTAVPTDPPLQFDRESRRALWFEALRQRSVWMRAVKFGLPVGLLQAAINQGDHWASGRIDQWVLLKSIVSPLIGFTLVLFSAAQTWVQRTWETSHKHS